MAYANIYNSVVIERALKKLAIFKGVAKEK